MDSKQNSSDYIEIREVIELFITKWKFVIKVVGIFIILGLFVAFGTTPQYVANSKFILKNESNKSSNLGGLGSLAGLAGINLDLGSNSGISPVMYTEVINSLPFIMELIDHPVRFASEGELFSTEEYFSNVYSPSYLEYIIKYTLKLPYIIKDWIFRSDVQGDGAQLQSNIYRLSKEEFQLVENMRARVQVIINEESGSIILSVKMPDPQAAAELNQFSYELLQKYITDFKKSKAVDNLNFVSNQFENAKGEYESIQTKLAVFNDRNKNINSALINAERQKIQNQYDLTFSVYKGLATQLEQAKISLNEATPMFSVLNPTLVPVEKSEPRRSVILILFTFFGGIFSLVTLFVKRFYL